MGVKKHVFNKSYLLMYQSSDVCILVRFISRFWSKFIKWKEEGRRLCNKNVLVSISKKFAVERESSAPDLRVHSQIKAWKFKVGLYPSKKLFPLLQ